MERHRTSAAEEVEAERDAQASGPSTPSSARLLAAALARIEALERREAALHAALAARGVDPDAILRAAEAGAAPPAALSPAPAAAGGAEAGQAPERADGSDPVAAAVEATTRSRAARSLAERLAEEVVAGPATVRLRAAERLVELAGAGAAPALLLAAREASGAARAALVEQLGRTGAADAAAAVVEFVADERAEVRAAAIEAAAKLVPEAELEPLLRIGLEDGDPRVRRRSALCAASIRSLDAGPLLTGLLVDPDRQVRRVACTALGGTGDPMAALALVGALLDDDPSVRNAAGAAAERLFGEKARGIVDRPPAQRAREVARLRAWVAANLVRLAPGGRLAPVEQEAPAAAAAVESVLDDLMETGHAGAGFEDDLPGWTEANDPALGAALARAAGGFALDAFGGAGAHGLAGSGDATLEAEALRLYAEADAARGGDAAASAGAAKALRNGAATPAAAATHAVDADEAAAHDGIEDAVAASATSARMVDAASLVEAGAPTDGIVAPESVPTADADADARAAADAEATDAAPIDPAVEAAADVGARAADAEAEAGGNFAPVDSDREPAVEMGADAEAEAESLSALAGADVDAAAETGARAAAEAGDEIDGAPAGAPDVAPESAAASPDADAEAPTGRGAAAAASDVDVQPGAESAMIEDEDEADAGPPFEAIEAVLRAALRGCTDAALAEELGWEEAALAPSIEAHLGAGRLVRRGRKLFLP